MSYQDEVHNAVTCSSPTCPCHEWSQRKTDEAILNDIDAVLLGLSPFAAAWASAPESMKRYCEEDVARWFFNQGWIDGHKVAVTDLSEMERLTKERLR